MNTKLSSSMFLVDSQNIKILSIHLFHLFFFLYQLWLSDFPSWNYPASNPCLVGRINCITRMAICCPFNSMLSRKADPSNNWLEEVRKNNV